MSVAQTAARTICRQEFRAERSHLAYGKKMPALTLHGAALANLRRNSTDLCSMRPSNNNYALRIGGSSYPLVIEPRSCVFCQSWNLTMRVRCLDRSPAAMRVVRPKHLDFSACNCSSDPRILNGFPLRSQFWYQALCNRCLSP